MSHDPLYERTRKLGDGCEGGDTVAAMRKILVAVLPLVPRACADELLFEAEGWLKRQADRQPGDYEWDALTPCGRLGR